MTANSNPDANANPATAMLNSTVISAEAR